MEKLIAMPVNWSEWASLFQITQFAVVLIALIIAAKQFKEASKARELSATNILIEQVGNETIREIRTWFLHEFKNYDNPSKEDLEKIRKLAVTYDRVGLMIKQGLVPEHALYIWQKDEIKKLWTEITPFVSMVRIKYNRPNYCSQFEYLATTWLKKMEKKD